MHVRGAGMFVLPVALATMGAPDGARGEGLQPYQMVRSLQLVQDRLADGDAAALPIQRKLLELIDARMVAADPADFKDQRNFDALLIYGMSGGNPTTLEIVLPRLELDDQGKRIGQGIIDYLRGRTSRARQILQTVDPRELDPDLGAFLALVEGALSSQMTPQKSLDLFDYARLLSPGTLIEEAALRRSMTLTIELQKPERFLRASDQYARRFLRSPYASQFATSFVGGIVALHDKLDLDDVASVIAEMSEDHARTIYLRIARQAVIERYQDLVDFTDAWLAANQPGADVDPRQELYLSLGALTSETIGEIAGQLSRIDRSQLSNDDLKLLDAAEAVAAEVLANPTQGVDTSLKPASITHDQDRKADPAAAAADDQQAAATTDIVEDAKKRIEAVDRLLEETGQ